MSLGGQSIETCVTSFMGKQRLAIYFRAKKRQFINLKKMLFLRSKFLLIETKMRMQYRRNNVSGLIFFGQTFFRLKGQFQSESVARTHDGVTDVNILT